MDSPTLYQSLTARGVRLTVERGKLQARPGSLLTDADRDHIRQLKPVLLDYLQQRGEPEPLTLTELEALLGYPVQPADGEPAPSDGWGELFDHDRQRLLCPPERIPPCSWCGGRNIHAADCFTLDTAGPMVMQFGKHRGTPLACLDRKYLLWLRDNAGADFASAISKRRRCPPLTPEQMQEIRRLLHAEKHDYQLSPLSG